MAEGVTSNIFWVKDDILYTPSLEAGILPGITRAWILEQAQSVGMEIREGLFTKNDVEQGANVLLQTLCKSLFRFAS